MYSWSITLAHLASSYWCDRRQSWMAQASFWHGLDIFTSYLNKSQQLKKSSISWKKRTVIFCLSTPSSELSYTPHGWKVISVKVSLTDDVNNARPLLAKFIVGTSFTCKSRQILATGNIGKTLRPRFRLRCVICSIERDRKQKISKR